MNKKVIIFDFDGVIIDSWHHSYSRNLKDWPDLQPHQHKSFFNGNIFEEIAKMPPSVVSKEDMEKWLLEEFYPAKKKLPMFVGIAEVVKKLAEEYILVINTSATFISTQEYLAEQGLDVVFDKIYGLEISKDKIQKFKQILEDYHVTAEECVLVTDTVGDVLEAQHCAIASIVVTYGYQDRSFFESIKDEVVGFADRPEQILGLIVKE
jgi:phosphoglycolate phosphatase-like HAD superfamily hydrolase